MAKSRKISKNSRKAGRPRKLVPTPSFNPAESPLAILALKRDIEGVPAITEAQFLAGERLRVDYTLGRLEQQVTADWQRIARSGTPPDMLTERVLAARQRLYAALDAVGPELSGILLEICCLCSGLEQAERRLELPARSGKAVLRMALTRLARHYGLIARLPSAAGNDALRHWATAGYRPRAVA